MSFASVATAMTSAGYLPFSSGPTTLFPGIVPLIHRLICPKREVDRFILFFNPKWGAKNHAQFSWVALLKSFFSTQTGGLRSFWNFHVWRKTAKWFCINHDTLKPNWFIMNVVTVATETVWNPPRLSGIDIHGNVKPKHYFEDEIKPLNHIMFPHWEG